MNTRSFLLSALIAGLVIGFLGNLPLLNIVNCFLCIFVWLGGILAVFLYGRFQHGQDLLTPGQGAGLGAVSGVIGVFVGMLVYMVTSAITAPLMTSLARALQIEGDMPWSQGGIQGLLISTTFFFCIDIILYPFFGALAGLLAAAVFWKKDAV
jgi:hypothetical protein